MSTSTERVALSEVFRDIAAEHDAQDVKWGAKRDYADGTDASYSILRDAYRELTDRAAARLRQTWKNVVLEEVYEALSETDPANLRVELVQCAAVLAQWIEAIDRRSE